MKSTINMLFTIMLAACLSAGCGNSPFEEAGDRAGLQVEYAFASGVTLNGAVLSWKCSASARGAVLFGQTALDSLRVSPLESEFHVVLLDNLESETTYTYTVICGEPEMETVGFPQTFTTTNLELAVRRRGIWIVGGLTHDNEIVAALDLFDPVDETWRANVTNVPTPRTNAAVTVLNGKIYIIGGLQKTAGAFAVSNAVEEYDPITNTWRTLEPLPVNLHGAAAGALGDAVHVLGGTTTLDMTTGTLFNQVYRLRPDVGSAGEWTTLTSSGTIFPRIDMSACPISGALYITGGRYYSDGSAFATSDAFVMGGNTTTSVAEAQISQARHGAGAVCYRPLPTDPNPGDLPAVLIFGGSTATNLAQPATFISPSATYDYYAFGSGTNAMQSGPSMFASVYMPAAEISYDLRRVYVFGGADALNNPTDAVHSLDLANPTAGSWIVATSMPTPRYAHKAVIINR